MAQGNCAVNGRYDSTAPGAAGESCKTQSSEHESIGSQFPHRSMRASDADAGRMLVADGMEQGHGARIGDVSTGHSQPCASTVEMELADFSDLRTTAREEKLTGLYWCEELFFSFDFARLIDFSKQLIEQDTEYGDAYAYRCFAALGENQIGNPNGKAYDLVDLLHDYFRACGRNLITDGAIVCRLFLKLVFGDLVKRIAGSRSGVRYTLQKSDPLCGGAFALLHGDFDQAERCFVAGIAEPGSRSYAFAGLGLLKSLHSDLPGALAAFANAGAADDDFGTIARLLQFEEA
jgi:hypothetical protein